MIHLVSTEVVAITSRPAEVYVKAFTHINAVMACFGILSNTHRVAHFLAQILHESGGLRVLEENLSYSPRRMTEVWPTRFPTIASAQPYSFNAEKLANKVYGGRLGNVNPGDGWKYRGRGLIQITGRDNYRRIGSLLDVNFENQPELINTETYALPVAAAVWHGHGCNRLADRDDLRAVTKAINGGYIGLADRSHWLQKTRELVHSDDEPRRTHGQNA